MELSEADFSSIKTLMCFTSTAKAIRRCFFGESMVWSWKWRFVLASFHKYSY